MTTKEDKRIRELYLINVESHLVSLLELLADNKLLIVSGTIVSVEDCLDNIKTNIKSAVQANLDDFLSFISSHTTINHNKISKAEKEAQSLRASLETLRKQTSDRYNKNEEQLLNHQQSLTNYFPLQDKTPTKQKTEELREEDLRIIINKLKQTQIQLRQELSAKEKAVRKQRSTATDLKVEVESLNELIKRLQSQNNRYTSKLYDANQTVDSLKLQVTSLENKKIINTQETECNLNEILRNKEAILTANQNERLKNQISMLNEKISYLQLKCESTADITEQELLKLREQGDERLKELNKIKIKLTSLEQQNMNLASQNHQLKKDLQRIQQQIVTLERRKYELQKQGQLKQIMRQENQKVVQEYLALIEQQKKQLGFKMESVEALRKELDKQMEKQIIFEEKESLFVKENERLERELQLKQKQIAQAKTKSSEVNTNKFMQMVVLLKQKQKKKENIIKKALGKIRVRIFKTKEAQNSLRQETNIRFKKGIEQIQRFMRQQLVNYKQKWLIYHRITEEEQYSRHLLLLRQVDNMREEVQRKEVKVFQQENRILETLKRQNQSIHPQSLLRVKSQDYLKYSQPSYVNRF